MKPTGRWRPRAAWKWRTAVLIAVHVLILVHIVQWLSTGRTIAGLEPSEAMEFSKHGVVNLGLVLLLGAALTTALFGRFFCGWGCHIIAVQDLCRWLLLKVGITPRPLRSRLLRIVPIVAFVYMFLWPIAYRFGMRLPFPEVTTALTTTNLWARMPGWIIGGTTIVVCGFAVVYVLGAKGFCTYACPYGALFGAADRLAPLRIRVTDACQHCARCTAACTSNVRVHEEVRDFAMVKDSGCMKCLDCVAACPTGALYLGSGRPALGVKPRVAGPPRGRPWNVGWTEEVILLVAFAAAFFTFRGLYGFIPFLMSLGLAGLLAFLVLTVVRMFVRSDLRFVNLRLTRGGRLTTSGRIFGLVMVGVGILWSHSALVRYHEVRADVAFETTATARLKALDLDRSPGPDRETVATAENGLDHLQWADRFGLVANPGSYFKVAWLAFLAGRTDDALAAIGPALSAQPKSAEVHRLQGRLLFAVGRPREAVMAMAEAVELDPESSGPFLSLGSLLGRLGDVRRAREVFRRGLERHPDDADLHYNFGVACALEGDLDQAAAAFRRALEIRPNHEQARENLDRLQSLSRE